MVWNLAKWLETLAGDLQPLLWWVTTSWFIAISRLLPEHLSEILSFKALHGLLFSASGAWLGRWNQQLTRRKGPPKRVRWSLGFHVQGISVTEFRPYRKEKGGS